MGSLATVCTDHTASTWTMQTPKGNCGFVQADLDKSTFKTRRLNGSLTNDFNKPKYYALNNQAMVNLIQTTIKWVIILT